MFQEKRLTLEHLLPLPIQDTRPALQVLALQPLRQRHRLRIRRPGVLNRDLLARCWRLLLLLHLALVSRWGLWLLPLSLGLCFGLRARLQLALVVRERFRLELVDVLLHAHARGSRLALQLGALLRLELLGCEPAPGGFGGHGGLHLGHLLRVGTLLRWALGRWALLVWSGCGHGA